MPLTNEPLKAERRGAVRKFFSIVKDDEGVSKKVLLARARLALGVRKSTAYDYYETLRDADKIVEDDGAVWTAEGYERLRQERLDKANEEEKRVTSVIRLEAFDTERPT